MARVISWTDVALEDVEEAAAFIARDSPRFAAALVSAVLSAVDRLSEFPESGRVVSEVDQRDIREIVVQHHRLIYQMTSRDIRILAFIHGARDLPSLWESRVRPKPEA